MKTEIEAKIEYQEIIGEAKPGDYQPVRFTRIKYKASPTAHIDIRQFQRGYDDEGEEAFFPTKKGFRFPESEFKRVVKEYRISQFKRKCEGCGEMKPDVKFRTWNTFDGSEWEFLCASCGKKKRNINYFSIGL